MGIFGGSSQSSSQNTNSVNFNPVIQIGDNNETSTGSSSTQEPTFTPVLREDNSLTVPISPTPSITPSAPTTVAQGGGILDTVTKVVDTGARVYSATQQPQTVQPATIYQSAPSPSYVPATYSGDFDLQPNAADSIKSSLGADNSLLLIGGGLGILAIVYLMSA